MLNEFFASIYETFYYSNEFSGDLYNENLYQLIGILMIISSFLIPIVYYKFIDKVEFAKTLIWILFVLLSSFILNFIIAYILPTNTFVGLGLEYDSNEFLSFALVNGFFALLIAFIASLLVKNFSTNCKKIPF